MCIFSVYPNLFENRYLYRTENEGMCLAKCTKSFLEKLLFNIRSCNLFIVMHSFSIILIGFNLKERIFKITIDIFVLVTKVLKLRSYNQKEHENVLKNDPVIKESNTRHKFNI